MSDISEGFFTEVDQQGDVIIVSVGGELDLATGPRVARLCSELAQLGCTRVVIDAREVTFVDARGMTALIEGRSVIHENGSSFIVVPSARVRRLIDLLDLQDLFPDFSSIDEAVQHVRGGTA